MACKRTATSDLNHENWAEEDEPEEAGTFIKASKDVLEKRVVKAARRRLPRSEDASLGNSKSPFGMFSGFKTTPAPSSLTFSFLAKPTTAENTSTTQNTVTTTTSNTRSNGGSKIPENGNNAPAVSFSSTETTAKVEESKKVQQSETGDPCIFKKSSDYFAKLKGLNESVTQWIKSHVDTNPFCILTPIFRDYEKYLKEIEAKHGQNTADVTSDEIKLDKPLATSSKLSGTEVAEKTTSDLPDEKNSSSIFHSAKTSITNPNMNWSSKPGLLFGSAIANTKSELNSTTEKKDDKPLFSSISTEKNPFLNKTGSLSQISEGTEKTKSETSSSNYMSFGQSAAATATFSFGQSTTTSPTHSAGFSFGSAKPFSFGSHVAASQDSETKQDNEEKEDEDEPPKPDFKPITEEDAFFEKRCKVFVKKDGNFSDRGIGVLFLKSTPNGKTQLIVRADNSLGNLLLNTLLTTSIPTKRMNKNTVMLVCLPLPDSEPPPTPVLLRVKSSEDADNLIETLDSNKK